MRSSKEPPAPESPLSSSERSTKPPWRAVTRFTSPASAGISSSGAVSVSDTERSMRRVAPAGGEVLAGPREDSESFAASGSGRAACGPDSGAALPPPPDSALEPGADTPPLSPPPPLSPRCRRRPRRREHHDDDQQQRTHHARHGRPGSPAGETAAAGASSARARSPHPRAPADRSRTRVAAAGRRPAAPAPAPAARGRAGRRGRRVARQGGVDRAQVALDRGGVVRSGHCRPFAASSGRDAVVCRRCSRTCRARARSRRWTARPRT